jgi:hypothetical protein
VADKEVPKTSTEKLAVVKIWSIGNISSNS